MLGKPAFPDWLAGRQHKEKSETCKLKTRREGRPMTHTKNDDGKVMFHCPVEATLSKIGGKYKSIIIYHLHADGTLRFSQLQRLIPQATAKMLTRQLRELEADGFVHREVYPVVPPKTEYSLTEKGKTLVPIVVEMCEWGRKHLGDQIIQPE
jgi:DNA-binding HxlR family transcriptional regulator